MAKYDIKMSCGHTVTIELYGKMDAREKRIHYLEQYGICPACWEAMRDEWEAARELPPLEGTEKQIVWARRVRQERIKELEKLPEPATSAEADLRAAFLAWLNAKTKAAEWIDSRDLSLRALIMKAKEEGVFKK